MINLIVLILLLKLRDLRCLIITCDHLVVSRELRKLSITCDHLVVLRNLRVSVDYMIVHSHIVNGAVCDDLCVRATRTTLSPLCRGAARVRNSSLVPLLNDLLHKIRGSEAPFTHPAKSEANLASFPVVGKDSEDM
jgi:hypothetical protein